MLAARATRAQGTKPVPDSSQHLQATRQYLEDASAPQVADVLTLCLRQFDRLGRDLAEAMNAELNASAASGNSLEEAVSWLEEFSQGQFR